MLKTFLVAVERGDGKSLPSTETKSGLNPAWKFAFPPRFRPQLTVLMKFLERDGFIYFRGVNAVVFLSHKWMRFQWKNFVLSRQIKYQLKMLLRFFNGCSQTALQFKWQTASEGKNSFVVLFIFYCFKRFLREWGWGSSCSKKEKDSENLENLLTVFYHLAMKSS